MESRRVIALIEAVGWYRVAQKGSHVQFKRPLKRVEHRSSIRSEAEAAMTQFFIGLIYKDPDSDYGVAFPDFPGCVTAGRTLDEAQAMAEEALVFHIEGMSLDGLPIPEPSSLAAVMSDPENRDGVAIMIPVVPRAEDSVRFGLDVPSDVLARIDAFTQRHGIDRTGFFLRAAEHELEHS